MNWKKIIVATILGGIILTIANLVFQPVANAIAPYDIFEIGGMRSIDDPVIALFFAYPFVFAFSAAVVFDVINAVFRGNATIRGIKYGILLIVIYTIPSLFVIYSSMSYPPGFYIANILTSLIGYPALGIAISMVWDRL